MDTSQGHKTVADIFSNFIGTSSSGKPEIPIGNIIDLKSDIYNKFRNQPLISESQYLTIDADYSFIEFKDGEIFTLSDEAIDGQDTVSIIEANTCKTHKISLLSFLNVFASNKSLAR